MLYKDFKGKKLSRLGMGNMRLPETGVLPKRIDAERAREVIEKAFAGGINYFDTAYVYHGGKSEGFLGSVLADFPREDFYIADKYLAIAGPDPEKMFEEQLRRCGVDRFDFYLIHNVNELTWKNYLNGKKDCIGYFMKQRDAGRIGHLGFSSHGKPDTLEGFLDAAPKGAFEFVQIQLNYLDWSLQNAKRQYDIITSHGLPVWVMEPVRGGKLASLAADSEALLKAAHPEWSIASWAFRWLFRLDNVQMILSGMTSVEQLADNLETFSACEPLSDADTALLMNVCAAEKKSMAVPCTGCRYCVDSCPKGLDIPALMTAYNNFVMTGERAQMKAGENGKNAADCIACGACTKHCPQSIEVSEVMKKLARIASD